jgi:hypothetical protein
LYKTPNISFKLAIPDKLYYLHGELKRRTGKTGFTFKAKTIGKIKKVVTPKAKSIGKTILS